MLASLFNMQPSNTLKIYIPRILGNVSQKTLRSTFDRLNIGKVFYVDTHRKINENNHIYYFAFLDIELYNTLIAKKLVDMLNKNELVKLVYDEEAAQYWEIKKHIPRNNRKSNAAAYSANDGGSSSVMPVLYETFIQHFNDQDEAAIDDTILDVFDYDSYITGNASSSYNMWENDFDLHSSIIDI